jgi:6-phosphogluconolactonase
MTQLECFDDKHEFAFAAIQVILQAARTAVRERGRFTLALSGGKTPWPVYESLAHPEYPMPWERVHLFFGDERAVPADDPRSNYRMVATTLLSRIDIPGANVHRITLDDRDPEAAAACYEADIRAAFGAVEGELPAFDLILLGLGGEGHTASLFPGSPLLEETVRLVAAAPVPGAEPAAARVTMTLPLINAAREVLFLTAGPAKRELAERILANDPSVADLPAARVQPVGKRLWLHRC